MKKCSECGGSLKEHLGKTPESIQYRYYKCRHCGEEIVDMKQLHAVATQYRTLKSYHAKLSKWGLSLGMRIPKEVVKKYHLKDNSEVVIIPEAEDMKVMPV